MKMRERVSRRILWVLFAAIGPAAFAFGQSQPESSQSSQSSQQSSPPAQAQPEQKKADTAADAAKKPEKDKPKPKKVYTEEDLSGMRGNGVSVVGDGAAAGGGATGTRQAGGNTKPGVAPMSGQDEDYWRGKARAILDAIAATDQEMAKTRDEIKKYGNDGFDAQTGLKDNVIYIDSRGGKLQQLEKRKADLQKKMDDLQEEGRKAGAESSWFR